jgi:protein-disulfide isomerase
MSRSLFLSLAAALLLAFTGSGQAPAKKSALDKATLEAYVRHLFVMDSRIKVEVGDPKPSTELPNFVDVAVRASMGVQSQVFNFLVSKDGSKILQGNVFDINNNPFKRDLDKLKTGSAPALGTSGAPVVVVAFTDFQCPYCKDEAAMIRQNLVANYPTQVRYYFKEFPIESLHPWAKPAAMAGRCVFRQQPAQFWEFHDWVFAQQAQITPETFKDKVMAWAKEKKEIDSLQLSQCLDTKATEAEVDKSMAEGKALGLDGTPTLYINGRKIGQSIDWPNLKSIIDFEIEYQKTAKNAGEDSCCEVKLNLPGMAPPPPVTPMAPAPKKK